MKCKWTIFLVAFITTLITLSPCYQSYGQDANLADISNDLNRLSTWSYSSNNTFGPDSLMFLTGKRLLKFSKRKVIEELDSLDNFDRLSSKDSKINVYGYSYTSGGSGGPVSRSVIQWKKNDGSYGAYELFPTDKKGYNGMETHFYEIYNLPIEDKALYLLIGIKGKSGRFVQGNALVIQIKNDYLILDYPAFMGKASYLYYHDDLSSGESECLGCNHIQSGEKHHLNK